MSTYVLRHKCEGSRCQYIGDVWLQLWVIYPLKLVFPTKDSLPILAPQISSRCWDATVLYTGRNSLRNVFSPWGLEPARFPLHEAQAGCLRPRHHVSGMTEPNTESKSSYWPFTHHTFIISGHMKCLITWS